MRYGIDLGGTKIEIVALDDNESITFRHRVKTPKNDYSATLEAISFLLSKAVKATGQRGSLGVGIPGALSRRTGRVKNANSTWLIGKDLQRDLQHKCQQPVRLENDANCFALSEASDGAAQGAEIVFGVIIGTGCGAGLVANGRILQGINAIGGEWGHNPLPWMTGNDIAMPCYCGLTGCNETFLSGTSFSNHFQQQTGKRLAAECIVELAEQGDEQAIILLDQYSTWLAKGLASVINLIDPDVIVLGGGMGNIDLLYEIVPQKWQEWVFSDQVETQLRKPIWSDSSGVRGAAWLGSKSL